MIMLAVYAMLLSGWLSSRAAFHGHLSVMQETQYHLSLARLYSGSADLTALLSVVLACIGAMREFQI